MAVVMSEPDLVKQIEENATKPASASQDGRSASQHSLSDQIAAAKFVGTQKAQQNGGLGIRITRLKPPGGA